MLASPISTYQPPSYESEESDWQGTFSEAVLNTVDETIDGLSTDLRTLSLDIWGIVSIWSVCGVRSLTTSFRQSTQS